MDKEITLLPADRYMVINKSILTDVDQKNLISFYEPIIGHLATCLYLTLVRDLEENKQISRDLTHHHLMSILKTPLKILKEARLAKGISLADAEKATSIRSRYLQAVENDEYDKTPGEVFLKGIIRNYGNYLGLNGPELVNEYKASAAGMAAEAVRSQGIREVEKVRLNIQLKDKRDIGSGTGRFEMPGLPKLPMKQCLAGLAAVAVLTAGYFAIPATINYFKNMPKEEAKQTEQVKPEAKAPAVLDKVTVDLEAEGDCWLEASADGKELFAGILHAKESKHFEAKDKLIVKYGNIGVVRIKVNGEAVDLKGEHGVAVKTYLRNAPAQPAAAAKAEEAAPQPEAKAAPAAAVEEAAPQPAAAAPAPKAEEPKPQAEVKQAEPQQPQAAGEAKADKKK